MDTTAADHCPDPGRAAPPPEPSSDQLFRQLSDASPIGVFRTDLDGRCTYTNPRWQELTGMTLEASLGNGWIAAVHPDDRDAVLAGWGQSIDTLGSVALEFRFVTPQGKVNWVIARAVPLRGADGAVVGFLGTNEDITERKQAEEALRAKSENLQVLLDVAQDVGGTLDTATLLGRLLQRLAVVLPCDLAITFYREPENEAFRIIHRYGFPVDQGIGGRARTFTPDPELLRLLPTDRPTVINDVSQYGHLPLDLLAGFQIDALVILPLRARGRTIGGLVVARKQPAHDFDDAQTALLQALSPFVATALESAETHYRQRREGRVAAALARVGRELIASQETPAILERLCRLSTSVLSCDFSHAFLLEEEHGVLRVIAGHGDTPEQWQSMQLLRVPIPAVAKMLSRLERESIAQIVVSEPQNLLPAELPQRYGITAAIYLALKRQNRLHGVLTAGFRRRRKRFDTEKEQIARGLAHLASLALENARLLEELEQANRIKSDFVAGMSHELRSPLHIILGYNELLLDGEFGPLNDEQADTLRIMHRSGTELVERINATLDLSRLESRKVPLEVREFDVAELVAELRREIEASAPKAEIQASWEVDADVVTLRSDRLKVKMILLNLLGNAFKFTDSGEVVFSVRRHDGGVEFAVRDSGIGIAPEHLETIFEPFRQAAAPMTRRHGGAGLGLYIVRRLLNVIGGTIAVQSTPGVGSTFRVWLPPVSLEAVPAAPPERSAETEREVSRRA